MEKEKRNLENKDLDNVNRDDKEIENMMQKDADHIEVPDSLKPENIEIILEEKAIPKKRRRMHIYGIAVAACCCLVAGIAVMTAGDTGSSQNGSDNASARDKASTSEESIAADAGDLTSAKDYDEIYEYIEAYQDEMYNSSAYSGASSEAKTVSESAADTASSAAGAYSGDAGSSAQALYSETNIRTDGVEEGDSVKTDGKNLYIMSMNRVKIVNIEQDTMEEIAVIDSKEDDNLIEILLSDDKLVCVYSRTEYNEDSDGNIRGSKDYTTAEVFDISDPGKPKSLGEIAQSGYFHTVRMSGDYVYLLSDFYANTDTSRSSVTSYVPEIQGKALDSSRIYLPTVNRGYSYTVVTAFNVDNPKEETDSVALFGSGGQCYMSNGNIYMYESLYSADDSDVTQTNIRKVSYKDGELKGEGQVMVDGTLNDSFSIDEYNGYLRLVTTVDKINQDQGGIMPLLRSGSTEDSANTESDRSNSLYILDENLRITGQIENLAEDEQIYSARLMGDIGYFVTFEQVDPLFSVDLSDPKNPEILGALKIPGFSDYLHPYGDGKLLGIGMDVDEEGIVTNGAKLSMFDISDPSDVQEVQKEVIEGCYSVDVSYNYKAALVSAEKNLIGFSGYEDTAFYYLYSYDEKDGFQCLLRRQMSSYSSVRGVYSGDRFYIVTDGTVESFRMGDYTKLDDLVL